MNKVITYILNVFWKFNMFLVRLFVSVGELRGLNAGV